MTQVIADTRKAFSRALCELAQNDDRILGMSADMGYIIAEYMDKFPERFINVGIAEPNLIGMASGLAMSGMIPFVTTMSCFLSLRACEQIRTDVCYADSNVKIVGTAGGTAYGNQGNTHMALEDMAVVSSFANMVVLAPADGVATQEAVRAAAKYVGPVYIRIGRGETPMVYEDDYSHNGQAMEFQIGKSNTLREGSDVTIIATGCVMVRNALEAANLLKRDGISARVIDMYSIKPLDCHAILQAANETRAIVTAEDHQLRGGLGSAVCQVVAAENPIRVKCLGVPDVFAPIADHDELLRRYSLDAQGIAKAARSAIGEGRM